MSPKKGSKVRAAETVESLDSTGRQRQLKRDEVRYYILLTSCKQNSYLYHRLFVKSWNKSLIRKSPAILLEHLEKINVLLEQYLLLDQVKL
jgi:hypothetical protein